MLKLLHVGLQVNDYRKTRDFFSQTLGMEEIYTGTIGEFRHILNPAVDPLSDTREQMGYVRACQGQYFELFEGIVAPPDFDPRPIFRYSDMPFAEIGLGVRRPNAAAGDRSWSAELREGRLLDPDGNLYRLIELEEPAGQHLVYQLAYVAIRVNDPEAAADFYTRLGLRRAEQRRNGAIEMQTENGSLLLLPGGGRVRQHMDSPLSHFAFGVESLEELRSRAEAWAKMGIPAYRNSNKDEVIQTEREHFHLDAGPDGSISLRVFDPEDNCSEFIYMPPDNRQNLFERERPFR